MERTKMFHNVIFNKKLILYILLLFMAFNDKVKGSNISVVTDEEPPDGAVSEAVSGAVSTTETPGGVTVDMEELKRHLWVVLPVGQGQSCALEFYNYVTAHPGLSFHLSQCYCYNQTEFCEVENVQDIDAVGKELRKYVVFPLDKALYKIRAMHISMTALSVFIGILGLAGNLLVIITVFGWLPRDNVTYIFIANLSIADFLVIIGCLPLRTYEFLYIYWYLDMELCQFMTHLFYTSLALSVFTQTAMAMERYLVICFPMKAQIISTSSRARKICAGIWVLALSVAILPTYMVSTVPDHQGATSYCHVNPLAERNRYITQTVYIDVVLFLVPLAFMTFAYTSIGKTLYQSIKDSRQMTETGSNTDRRNAAKDVASTARNRIKVVRMLVIVLVVFILCWMPFIIYYTIEAVEQSFFSKRLFLSEAHSTHFVGGLKFGIALVTYFNSCINPILYAFLSEQFRKGMMNALTCGRRRKRERDAEFSSKMTGISTISTTTLNSGGNQ